MAAKLTAVAAVLGLLATLLSLGAWKNHAGPRRVEATQPRAFGRSHGRHSLAKKLLATTAVLALSATVVSITVLAVFTDTQSVGNNTFTTGSVVDISTSPTTTLVTFSGMMPGDEVTNPITVSNPGTPELRYAVTSTTTEDVLAAELDLTIKSGVTTCTNAGFDTDGSVVYPTGDLGSMAGINVIGDPTQGADTGDRTLTGSGGSEILCFNVALPLASTGPEDTTTTATFAFQAEQTQSNP